MAVMNRTVRRCFLLGDDRFSGKNNDHRKIWIAEQLVQQARYFGIDLLCQAILSNHIYLVLRSRPDVVAESKPRSASSSGSAARPGVPFRSSDKACCSERSVEGKTNCRRTGDVASAIYPEGVAFQSPGFAVKPRTLGSADWNVTALRSIEETMTGDRCLCRHIVRRSVMLKHNLLVCSRRLPETPSRFASGNSSRRAGVANICSAEMRPSYEWAAVHSVF